MTPFPTLDPHLLNKIQSIKTLRDRAATPGEKDAAQNRLTLILAKHKLTEQDIPTQGFSTRGRTSPFQQRPDSDADFESFTMAGFEQVLREMEDAILRHSRSRPRSTPGDTGWEPSKARRTRDDMRTPTGKGKKTARERFEHVLGKQVSQAAWNVVSKSQKQAKKRDEPSNPAAYARAFYEAAGIGLRHRLSDQPSYLNPATHKLKSNNPEGVASGFAFASKVSLHWFDTIAP